MGPGERAPGMEHIPKYPPGFITIRILQLIVGLICLGLSAYTVAAAGALSGNSIMLFTSLVTIGVTIWLITAHSCAKRAYNYWAVLIFDIFLYIFWLVSFSTTAINTIWASDYYDYWYDYDIDSSIDWDEDYSLTLRAVLAAAAGLGALNFLFFFISLIIHSCVVYRHRRAGLHSKPVKSGHASQPFQMTPQTNTNYAAVPQHGMPFNNQETAYNPHGMYAPPMQQQQQQQQQQPQGYPPQQQQTGYYGGGATQGYYSTPPPQTISPVAPQPTGPFHKPVSPQPPQGAYQVPYQPHYQAP